MCLGKPLCGAAVRTLSLCDRNIHGEYLAQFTCGSVTVKVIVGIPKQLREEFEIGNLRFESGRGKDKGGGRRDDRL